MNWAERNKQERERQMDEIRNKDLSNFKKMFDSLPSEDKQKVRNGLKQSIAELDQEIQEIESGWTGYTDW